MGAFEGGRCRIAQRPNGVSILSQGGSFDPRCGDPAQAPATGATQARGRRETTRPYGRAGDTSPYFVASGTPRAKSASSAR
jgi:hypothetical protein